MGRLPQRPARAPSALVPRPELNFPGKAELVSVWEFQFCTMGKRESRKPPNYPCGKNGHSTVIEGCDECQQVCKGCSRRKLGSDFYGQDGAGTVVCLSCKLCTGKKREAGEACCRSLLLKRRVLCDVTKKARSIAAKLHRARAAQQAVGRRTYSTLLRLAIETSLPDCEGIYVMQPKPPTAWVAGAVSRAGEDRAKSLTMDFGLRSFLLEEPLETALDVLDYELADFRDMGKPGHELEATPAREPTPLRPIPTLRPFLLPTHRSAVAASSLS